MSHINIFNSLILSVPQRKETSFSFRCRAVLLRDFSVEMAPQSSLISAALKHKPLRYY